MRAFIINATIGSCTRSTDMCLHKVQLVSLMMRFKTNQLAVHLGLAQSAITENRIKVVQNGLLKKLKA